MTDTPRSRAERIELPNGYFITLEGDYAYLRRPDYGHLATLEKYGTQDGFKTTKAFAAAMNSAAELAAAKVVELANRRGKARPQPVTEGLREALELALPLARAHAARHPLEINISIVRQAEEALAAAPTTPPAPSNLMPTLGKPIEGMRLSPHVIDELNLCFNTWFHVDGNGVISAHEAEPPHSPVSTAKPDAGLSGWIANELRWCKSQGRASKSAVYILEKMQREFPALARPLDAAPKGGVE